MATLDHLGNINLPGHSKATQLVSATTDSAQSAAFNAATNCVRIWATATTFMTFGKNPTAVANGTCHCIPANAVEYWAVFPGDKVAVITGSTATVYISEF